LRVISAQPNRAVDAALNWKFCHLLSPPIFVCEVLMMVATKPDHVQRVLIAIVMMTFILVLF